MSQPSTSAILEILEDVPVDVVAIEQPRRVVIEIEPQAQIIEVITPGPIGPRGPLGPQGLVGPFAPTFVQHFANPSMQWVIVHDLDVIPVVTLYDENHEEMSGDVMTPDRTTVIVTFELPMAGTARLKA